jgi:hypothetical protein
VLSHGVICMIDYTTVVGVDAKHLRQLAVVWPTWARHKPSLLKHPMVAFFDVQQVRAEDIRSVVGHPNLRTVPWPPDHVVYEDQPAAGRFGSAQRYKMLAGFVHAPARCVETEYWLKIDTDVVATGEDDWIDGRWFAGSPVIVAHPWGFTKPPDQMLRLDEWAEGVSFLSQFRPLGLAPKPGWTRLTHKRIISWCAFFRLDFTSLCSQLAERYCGCWRLPVPSQDGFLWYCAQRLGLDVVRTGMKGRGWEHWSTEKNVLEAARRALDGQ